MLYKQIHVLLLCMTQIKSNKKFVEMATLERILEIDLIFDKVHRKLSNKDKLSLLEATYGNQVIQTNFKRKNHHPKAILCPACLLDFPSNEIPWIQKRLIQPDLVGTMKLPLGNLLLRNNLEKWANISPLVNPDGEEYIVKMVKYGEGLDFVIPGTQSSIKRVNLVEAEEFFKKNFACKKFEEFESVTDLLKHFSACHTAAGKTPKPKRKLCLTRENNRQVYKVWPVYDLPIITTVFDFKRMNYGRFYPLKQVTEEVRVYHKDYNCARLMRIIRNQAFIDYVAFFANIPPVDYNSVNQNYDSKYCNILYSVTILLQILEHSGIARGRYPANISTEVNKNLGHFMMLTAFCTRHFYSVFQKHIRDI